MAGYTSLCSPPFKTCPAWMASMVDIVQNRHYTGVTGLLRRSNASHRDQGTDWLM